MDRCRCGNEIVQSPGPGRRRLKCTECSPVKPRKRADGVTELARVQAPAPVPPSALHTPGEVEASIRRTLDRAGRIERYQGVLAIRLARQLDADMSKAGAQSLADSIDKLMIRALDGWVEDAPEPDFLDRQADPRDALRGRGA